MFPMDRTPLPIVIEYTSRGKRGRKRFEDSARSARAFYVAKDKAGAEPRVLKPEETTREPTLFDRLPD